MTQVQFTLTEEEILQVLSGDREEAFKMMVKKILDQIMLAESAEQLGADRHERTDERQDYRNGTRTRMLTTRIGTIELEVPRHRNEPFHTMIFENYKSKSYAVKAFLSPQYLNSARNLILRSRLSEIVPWATSRSRF